MDSDFKKNLVLKPVGEEHLAQYDELLSYVFQVTESDIENSGYENKREMVRAKKPVLEQSKVFGWFHDENLISHSLLPSQGLGNYVGQTQLQNQGYSVTETS